MSPADYRPLSDAEVRGIASAYFGKRQGQTVAHERPTVVLVGGQPGAGKSAAASMVRDELATRGGYIHVDADRMRERIPVGDLRPSSEQTQSCAGRLAIELRELAIQGRRNIVEEGTFRNAEAAGQFAQQLKKEGYQVELVAVATSREESLVGIYQRHEQQHSVQAANPRFVPEAYHDNALQGFDTTLARTAAQLDRVRVVNRAGDLLFDSASRQNPQANASEAVAVGRQLTDSRLSQLGKAWAVVEAAAVGRGATAEYLDAIASHATRIDHMQKTRIHDHASSQVNAHAAVLACDSRFARHSSGELAKAAYFRGFHEKASEFKGIAPDFGKFDATYADRPTLRQFPAVTELDQKHGASHIRDADEQSR